MNCDFSEFGIFSEIWFQITNFSCSGIRLPKFCLKTSIHFGEITIYKSGQLMSINWSILIRGCNFFFQKLCSYFFICNLKFVKKSFLAKNRLHRLFSIFLSTPNNYRQNRQISQKYLVFCRFCWKFYCWFDITGIHSKIMWFCWGDRHRIVKSGDNVMKTKGIRKKISNPVPISPLQKQPLF
jgi:hypothetical protein